MLRPYHTVSHPLGRSAHVTMPITGTGGDGGRRSLSAAKLIAE
jgi:hypothetical protein